MQDLSDVPQDQEVAADASASSPQLELKPEPRTPAVAKKLPLVEIFGPTVQGEGAVIGQQTYFIRFGLCDYKCKLCDSMHAVDPNRVHKNAKWLTQDEIFQQFQQFHKPNTSKWVTISGGNPCIHDLLRLVDTLHLEGFSISVETQGTFCPEWLQLCNAICVSPKGPGLGEKLELDKLDDFIHTLMNHPGLYLKFVVFDQRDLEIASMLFERYVNPEFPQLRASQFFLSLGNPHPPPNKYETHSLRQILVHRYKSLLADIQVDKNLSRVRFLPQMHVLMWGNQGGI